MNLAASSAAGAVVAYSGEARGARSLAPVLSRLERALGCRRLCLFHPRGIRMPLRTSAFESVIEYPTVDADAESIGRSVSALSAFGAERAVIFTQAGWSADVPAYIAYLAGIRRRSGFRSEFGGGLLSDVVAEPGLERDGDRHLHLLAALGSDGGDVCAA